MKTAACLFVTAMTLGVLGRAVLAQTPAPPDPAKVAAGQALYTAKKCADCHAIKKVGGKLASDLDGIGTKLTADDIKKWFTNTAEMEAKLPKKPVMPMSTWLKTHKLTDAEIDAAVAYMRSLK